MPIKFDLESLRTKYNCKNYFETGLYDPRKEVSSKTALKCNFGKVFSIEIREDWVNLGREVFKEEIESGRYTLYLDDSTNMEQYLSNTNDFDERTIFFLDAHVDNSSIKNFKRRCPLFEELSSIKGLNRKDHIILVDDLRIIKNAYPWGETGFGKIDFLQQIKELILTINPEYKFDTLDGHVKDDVLVAYVE